MTSVPLTPKTIETSATGAKINTTPAPGIANPAHVNHIANFFKAIGHGIKDVFLWAPTIGEKTVKVIQESEELTPDFMQALKVFISDGAAIAGSAALAVASKGGSIASDINVVQGVEQLVADFNKYYPLLVTAFNDLQGIVLNDAPVVAAPPPVTDPITPAMLGAQSNPNVVSPGVFTPKTPKAV